MEAENCPAGAEGVEPDYLPSLRAASCVTLSFFPHRNNAACTRGWAPQAGVK